MHELRIEINEILQAKYNQLDELLKGLKGFDLDRTSFQFMLDNFDDIVIKIMRCADKFVEVNHPSDTSESDELMNQATEMFIENCRRQCSVRQLL